MRQKDFFEKIALIWDKTVIHDKRKIEYGLSLAGIKNEDMVLDIGTGTGVLIPYLYSFVGKKGRIDAVDFSQNMINIAKKKWCYSNVKFICSDIAEDLFEKNQYDVIICYSVFPHFTDKEKIINIIWNLLKNKGIIIIFHSQSRKAINNLHKHAGDEVREDVLPEIKEIVTMFEKCCFQVEKNIDDDEMFLITGRKYV